MHTYTTIRIFFQTNGPSAGFRGRYDTKTALQRILAAQASLNQLLILSEQKLEGYSSKTIDARVVVNGRGPRRRRGRDRAFRPVVLELYPSSFFEMVLPSVFQDVATRNRPYSVFSLTKRPQKRPFRLFSRTLRHEIGPTAYSRCPSVQGNDQSAGFRGHYDTKTRLQHVLAAQVSGEMAIPAVFADVTTQKRGYSMFWLPKRPGKWPFRWILRTLRHEIGSTACSGGPSVLYYITRQRLIWCCGRLRSCDSICDSLDFCASDRSYTDVF